MHSRYCFTKPFGSQRVDGSQTLQKSEREHFYPTFSSSWQMILLVRSEILGLFVKPLTADVKYSLRNAASLPKRVQMHFILKIKPFSWIFYYIFRMYIKFWTCWKKIEPHSLIIYQTIHYEKTWLLKSIACPRSELLSAFNALTGSKHCGSLQKSTFIQPLL